MIKNIKTFITRFIFCWKNANKFLKLNSHLENEIEVVKKIESDYNNKLSKAHTIFTTIQTFNSDAGDKVFWPWVRAVVASQEYKYLIFILRENVIREYTTTNDVAVINEINGKLKMLQILDSFLTQGILQYGKTQRND